MIGFEAAFRRHGAVDKAAEDMARNPHHAFVLTDADTKFDGIPLGVPLGILGKSEEHGAPRDNGYRRYVPVLFLAACQRSRTLSRRRRDQDGIDSISSRNWMVFHSARI